MNENHVAITTRTRKHLTTFSEEERQAALDAVRHPVSAAKIYTDLQARNIKLNDLPIRRETVRKWFGIHGFPYPPTKPLSEVLEPDVLVTLFPESENRTPATKRGRKRRSRRGRGRPRNSTVIDGEYTLRKTAIPVEPTRVEAPTCSRGHSTRVEAAYCEIIRVYHAKVSCPTCGQEEIRETVLKGDD